jgi:hypothetical protein
MMRSAPNVHLEETTGVPPSMPRHRNREPENGESMLSATALYIKTLAASREWSWGPPFEDWLKMS